MAKVYGIRAKIIVMLDEFLLVIPGQCKQTDLDALHQGEEEGRKFDQLFAQLN